MKLERYEGNPILSPNPDNSWESLVTSNPGVIYDGGKFYMLYRAAGDDDGHVIRFGLATSDDGVHFERAGGEPVFGPSCLGPDGGCVEDPRIVKIDDAFCVTYAYRPCPPGRYWTFAHDKVLLPSEHIGPGAPRAWKENLGNSALAVTGDFRRFRRLGRITSPVLDDRDVILFPQRIKGKFVMIHRPKEYVGEAYGVRYPSIWLKFSDDILDWETRPSHLLITGRQGSWEEKVGGAAPPVLTDEGWLMLYHGVAGGPGHRYSVGAMLLDRDNPLKVIARLPEPVLEPEMWYEQSGLYKGCVFPTGNVLMDGVLYVYYGAADKYVSLATCKLQDILDAFKKV